MIYLEHEGRVLAAAINKYCYLSVRWLPPHDNGFFVGNYAVDLAGEIDLLWRTLRDL